MQWTENNTHFRQLRSAFGNAVAKSLGAAALTIAALAGGGAAADAGPCSADISLFEQAVKQMQAARRPGGAGEPSAPQSIGAQLHHQPTPQSVGDAEKQADAAAGAALDRAKKADAEGKAAECAKALDEAKRIYGME